MTKKDKKTLSTLPSILRFMVSIAADPRGYESTQMTVRSFYSCYRRFCQSNELSGMLSLQGFSGQLHDSGIRGVVRDASMELEMPGMSQLRESLISDLGLSKKFFKDDASLAAAIGKRSTGIAGDFKLL